jgi:gamma-glutamylcyclotransferase (GGCT)/AIG2-like uncharacterized protein YtfP
MVVSESVRLLVRRRACVLTANATASSCFLEYNDDQARHATDRVAGTVFAITHEELQRADEYEIAEYKRVQVTLVSRTDAWVYVENPPRD